MKKRIALFVCILIVTGMTSFDFASDATGTLEGRVVDEYEKAPIAGVRILVYQSGAEDKKTYSDNKGHFQIELNPGYFDVFVTSTSFDPECRKIEIKSGKVTVYNARLRMSKIAVTAD